MSALAAVSVIHVSGKEGRDDKDAPGQESDLKNGNAATCRHTRPIDSYPWLDWLRFLAAFFVVATHARAAQYVEFSALEAASRNVITAGFFLVTRFGHEAVIVFFVLSGYLVGGRTLERLRSGHFRLKDYAVDRAARIFVPLVPAVLFTWIVQLATGAGDRANVVLGNIFGLQGILVPTMTYNGPLWSLSYEIWFYILCGGIAALAVRQLASVAFVVVVVSFAAFTVLDAHYLFCWAIGAFAYTWKPTEKSSILLISGIACAFFGGAFRQFGSAGFMRSDWAVQLPIELSTVLFASGIALTVTQLVLRRAPRSGVAARVYIQGSNLAAFSYSLYLVHYPVIMLLSYHTERSVRVDATSLVHFSIVMLASLCAAYIAYVGFEKHTGRVRKMVRLIGMKSSMQADTELVPAEMVEHSSRDD
ncbi:MAG: acyltransferase [Mesorhizobium sp.]